MASLGMWEKKKNKLLHFTQKSNANLKGPPRSPTQPHPLGPDQPSPSQRLSWRGFRVVAASYSAQSLI